MDIVCDSCQKKISIPDKKLENIPTGHVFSINCPNCKHKLSVEKGGVPVTEAKPEPAPKEQTPPADNESDMDSAASGSPFGFLEEGAKTSMICEPATKVRDIIRGVLKKQNYHISEPASPRDALKQMRSHEFQVIVINELFGTRDPDANHILKYLSSLKMNIRRNMFVTLLSNRFTSLHKMQAFNKSVNAIINLKDMNQFEKYFNHSFNDNEAFYRVFKESFQKIKG